MNFGRSRIAQGNEDVQNRDSWVLATPKRLILPERAPVPVDLQKNKMGNGTWQELLGMYSEILIQDEAVQTSNPTSVMVLNSGATTETNRNVGSYVQNFSHGSAGSSNNRVAELVGLRTPEIVASTDKRQQSSQIWHRGSNSNSSTQVASNWTQPKSNNLMLIRQHSILGSNQALPVYNRYNQVGSNLISSESTDLILQKQNFTYGSSQRLNSLYTQVGSNWLEPQANHLVLAKENCILGSNQRLSDSILSNLPDDGYLVPYQPNHNANSPPWPVTNAELSAASSFHFAPVTPDQGKQLSRQALSERLNIPLDECSSQEKDKQWNVVTSGSGEIENHPNEFSQIIVDSASAVLSTPLKEKDISDEVGEHGLDLNKTPDQKTPKKRKHRPKVVKEAKPKSGQKSTSPKTKVTNVSPLGKRKYVRKKNLKTAESQQDIVANEGTLPTVESATKECRRALNFDLEHGTGDASKMTNSHQAATHQVNKRPFNLNIEAEDKEICTMMDSMSRTSAIQIEQFRQQKEYNAKNLQTATEQISSQYALTEQSAPCTVPPKSKGHALNVIARNVNQNSSGRGYNHVLEHSRGEEIRRDYIQADSLSANVYVTRHPATQLAVGDSGSWHENRGFKRSHCDIVEQIHPHTQNLTGKPKYQKQQASAALHAYREQVAENVYQLEAHASYYQQVVESCSSNMSTNEQILKPVPKKQRSHRAEKVYLQRKNNALEIYQQTPKKARGKPVKHKMEYLIEELAFWLEGLSINSRRDVVEQEQHALVPYKGSNVIVPYEGFDNIKKRKPRPKVNIDPETDRIWKLLMGSEGGETAESTDKDKEKWWEEEREVFNRRAKSFIARMHQVQGDRRFSRWKGSVVDSVIGVFLTQNVSDHLSSSAFMSLAATFPHQSSVIVEEPDIQIIESNGSTRCHEQIGRQAYDPLNFQVSEGKIISSTRTHVSAEQQRTDYNSNVNNSPLKTTLSTELTLQNDIHSHVNNSSLFDGISTKWHAQSEDPLLRHNYPGGSAILLHQTNSHILHIREPVPSSKDIQLNMTPELRLKENHNFGILREESLPTFPNSPPTHSEITNMQGANLVRRWMTDTAEGKTHAQQNGMPTVQAPILGPPTFLGNHPTHKGSVQPDYNLKSSMNNHELDDSENFHLERTLITEPARQATGETEKSHGPHTQKLLDNAIEANAVEQSNSSVMPLNVTTTKVSHAKKGKAMAERKNKIDWDNLRKEAQSSGKRERSKETMDSLDYEEMRCSDVKKIADAIKERGMNNMLAERIKDFLNRLVDDHGSIDLEWLRDAPPDKAKDYLLSFRGLGLKSVECVRLLTLHQLAFPVDTNVGRIAVRLGWVPLQPLPESLQLHLLELYPILESIQKYLWPRLCKLDQETLYELHYQMITFGKVFCTKSKPNCNACPLRGECRHFASAFASARLALPGPEERNIVSSAVPFRADGDPMAAINPVPLLEAVQDQNKDAGILTRKEEPIVEEPSTPEHEITEFVESDIEDAFCDDPDEIPTIKLNIEEFTMNLQNYMQNMELQEGDMSRALVALNPEAASIPAPKLKNVSRLRTEHQVYQLPDSHPLLEGMDQREPDDPSPYLLAIWTPGETADSIQPPEQRCVSHESGQLCNDNTCFTCNSTRESNSQIVRGTILIPCRTATRGSFPLNGTYFQVNEMFADHESSVNPIHVPRSLIWNLPRRTVYFGTSVTSIFRGLPTEGIQYCFWKGFVCVRGFDQKRRAPRPLMARLHFPASKLAKNRKNEENT